MIKQITESVQYTEEELELINSYEPYSGHYWERPPARKPELNNLKQNIKIQLKQTHNDECAYCGLELGETSPEEIEHIAQKAEAKYPQFMFTPENLCLACRLCNGFSKKGNKDTIDQYNDEYHRCNFKIVHPYFDNPDDHFSWVDNEIRIDIISFSPKGSASIKMFDLAGEKQSCGRAKQKLYDDKKLQYQLSQELEDLVNSIMTYK